MKNPAFLKVTWDQLEKDCFLLAKKAAQVNAEKIVAISRGGLVWARVLSDLLSIPISHMTIESYKNLRQEKEAMISEAPSHSLENKTILLVDEISDSGKTFKRAMSYFANFPLKKIYIVAPYMKPHTKVVPDFYVHNLDSWIIFPYELKETYKAFVKMYKSEKTAQRKMKQLGYNDRIIKNIARGS